jgi:hypothetical protein
VLEQAAEACAALADVERAALPGKAKAVVPSACNFGPGHENQQAAPWL